MEMDSKVIGAVSAVVAFGILTYGIFHLTSSSSPSPSSSQKKNKSKGKEKVNGNGQQPSRGGEREEEEDTSLRGYKKTSTGRITTYFNRELTEEEKKLLGDQTPKRIDNGGTPSALTPDSLSPPPTTQGSVWNSAGTYEEKNITDWAQKTLRKKFKQHCHAITGGQVTITSVTAVEGDSTVTMVRGKKKYLYDITATLNWKLQATSPVTHTAVDITGSLTINDISADNDHEFQVAGISSSSPRNEVNPLVEKFIKSDTSSGFKSSLTALLKRFYEEMKETH